MASKNSPKSNLRSLDVSNVLFWKETAGEQTSLVVFDQNADYRKRELPENEVAVLALNEIAVTYKWGFFYHLPPRFSWTTPADADRLPTARKPAAPGPEYPTILFQSFDWTQTATDSFLADSHRARYLRSSAIANPPPDYTPLFAIQYVPQKCPVFVTTAESQVLFATSSSYYHASVSAFQRVLGNDGDNMQRLGSANWLWDRSSLDKGKDNRRAKDAEMAQFALPGLEQVYQSMVAFAREGSVETFTAASLRSLIPRPSSAAGGMVGRALGTGGSAEPPSRRGETRQFAPRRKRRRLEQGESASVNEPSDQDNEGTEDEESQNESLQE